MQEQLYVFRGFYVFGISPLFLRIICNILRKLKRNKAQFANKWPKRLNVVDDFK